MNYLMDLLVMKKLFSFCNFLSFLLLMSFSCVAQDLEPRAYINLPINQNILGVSYLYTDAEVPGTPSISLSNGKIRTDGAVVGYARTFALNGNAAKFDIGMPYFCTHGSAELDDTRVFREVCGVGDTRLRLTYNFYGAPAYDIKEFRQHTKELVVGASLQVSAPTGIYNENKLINIGMNRWFIRPEIGVSFPVRKWEIEMALDAKIFGDNKEFIGDDTGDATLSQEPIYNFQVHIVYDFNPSQWLAFNLNYYWGGKIQTDGVTVHDSQANSKIGFTFSQALNRRILVKMYFSHAVMNSIDNEYDTVGMSLLYFY